MLVPSTQIKRRVVLKRNTGTGPVHQIDEGAAKELADIINEALASPSHTDQQVSLTLAVMPDGQAWVTTDTDTQDNSKEDRTPTPEVAQAMKRAQERGKHVVAEILSQPDMLSSDEMKELMDVSRQTVNDQRRAGRLLGLQGAKRQFRYPRWQIGNDGRPFAEIKDLYSILGSPWPVYRFLTQKHSELGGVSGIDALREGRGEEAIAAAESQKQGNYS